MKTFVLFDRKTGQVVQTHVRSDDTPCDPEHLLRELRTEKEASGLGVLEVDRLRPDTAYRVDPKSRKLVAADPDKAKGMGGATVQTAGGDPLKARTVIVGVDRNG